MKIDVYLDPTGAVVHSTALVPDDADDASTPHGSWRLSSRGERVLRLDIADSRVQRAQAAPAGDLLVRIQGLDNPNGSGLWLAYPWTNHEPDEPGLIYQIMGDPNAVAVGRFKAGLRKFLGID